MRVALAELAPRPADVGANVDAVERTVRAAPADLVAFPELFLSGYRIGDRIRALAVRPQDEALARLAAVAAETGRTVVVGAPVPSEERPGEVENVALVVDPAGTVRRVSKRYLPTFGPFEEGIVFTPANRSAPVPAAGARLGVEICYDVFFPEVSRELAVGGADLLLNVSASPVTSRRLFERLLPARAVENGLPVLYVNRVGVEDGLVFGGGSGGWDARGEPIRLEPVAVEGLAPTERLLVGEVDLRESGRWRPFRPVLRDVVARPGAPPAAPP
jgi:predicted amidohydrolase